MAYTIGTEINVIKKGAWFSDQKFATKAEAEASPVKDTSKIFQITGESTKFWTYNDAGSAVPLEMGGSSSYRWAGSLNKTVKTTISGANFEPSLDKEPDEIRVIYQYEKFPIKATAVQNGDVWDVEVEASGYDSLQVIIKCD